MDADVVFWFEFLWYLNQNLTLGFISGTRGAAAAARSFAWAGNCPCHTLYFWNGSSGSHFCFRNTKWHGAIRCAAVQTLTLKTDIPFAC
jgi:hypothetical protein